MTGVMSRRKITAAKVVDNGVCENYRPKRDDIRAARVLLRYDWGGGGGFYLDHIFKNDIQPEHSRWLAGWFEDNSKASSATMLSQVKYFDDKKLMAMANVIAKANSKDALQVTVGQMQDAYDIRGVKAGLRSDKSRLIELKIHKMIGHLGFVLGVMCVTWQNVRQGEFEVRWTHIEK